jgi:hypothetical protein
MNVKERLNLRIVQALALIVLWFFLLLSYTWNNSFTEDEEIRLSIEAYSKFREAPESPFAKEKKR